MAKSLDVAGALGRVGRRLQEKYGNDPIPRRELQDETVKECGCSPGSVLPSDHCYNLTNDGIRLNNTPMFIHEGDGLYRFVGTGFAYNGPVIHHPKGGEPGKVGEWVEGKLINFA